MRTWCSWLLLVIVAVILSSALPSCTARQTASTAPQLVVTEESTLVPSPLPSNTNTPTATPSPSPTHTSQPTSTPTITPTPTPVPTGGAFIRYEGYDRTDGRFYCGVMTLDGNIVDQRLQLSFNDPDKLIPPFYCPDGGVIHEQPRWSPDGERYVYYHHENEGSSKSIVGLYLGQSGSAEVILINRFIEDFSDSNNVILAPSITWLDNQRLFYYQRHLKQMVVFDVDTREEQVIADYSQYTGDFHYVIPLVSPDGKRVLFQFFPSETEKTFELIDTEKGITVRLNDVISPDLKFMGKFILRPAWSQDSSKFVIIGEEQNQYVWIVFGKDGDVLSTLQPPDGISFENWAKWSLDGKKLLSMCNRNSSAFYLCLVNEKGDVESKFTHSHWKPTYWTQWSEDGTYLYYFAGAYTAASLYRVEVSTGNKELVSDDLHDYSWINDSRMHESYDFSEIDWSPDHQWMILNNSGPDMELYKTAYGKLTYTTAVLCDPSVNCLPMEYGSLVILGAEWWQPPHQWIPGAFLTKMDLSDGEVVFEDDFSSVKSTFWRTQGTVSTNGEGIRLDGTQSEALIETKNRLKPGLAVGFDFRYDSDLTRFQCGLTNSKGDTRFFVHSDGWSGYSFLGYDFFNQSGRYSDIARSHQTATSPNRWYSLYLRTVGNSQVQAVVLDKAANREVGGLNINIGSGFQDQDYKFQCSVHNGWIELNRFAELAFP